MEVTPLKCVCKWSIWMNLIPRKTQECLQIAKAKDYYNNLVQILIRLQSQLWKLQQLRWQKKFLRLFLFGDYDFLCKVMAISGHQGTYPCIWCLIKKSDMVIKRETRGSTEHRKLGQLMADHCAFINIGGSKKMKAAAYHNVLNQSLMDMVKQICSPYLHILLGMKNTTTC